MWGGGIYSTIQVMEVMAAMAVTEDLTLDSCSPWQIWEWVWEAASSTDGQTQAITIKE